MRECARQMLEGISKVATQLDNAHNSSDYLASVSQQQEKIEDASLTPAALYLNSMSEHNESHVQFSARLTGQYAKEFQQYSLAKDVEQPLLEEAAQSLVKKAELEREDSISFEEFLANYYRQ